MDIKTWLNVKNAHTLTICIYYNYSLHYFCWLIIAPDVAKYYSAPELVHIFPYPTNNLFITYALLSQKAL